MAAPNPSIGDFNVSISGACGLVQMPRSERTTKMLQASWINEMEEFLRRKLRGSATVSRMMAPSGARQSLFKLTPTNQRLRGKKRRGHLGGLQSNAMRAIRLFCRKRFRHVRQKSSAHERNEQRLTIRRPVAVSKPALVFSG